MTLRFTIGRRIGLGFSTLIFLTLVAFILTLATLKESRTTTDQVTDVYNPSVSRLKELNFLIARSRILIYSWLIHEKDDHPDKPMLKKLISEDYPQLKNKIETLSEKWTEGEREQVQGVLKDLEGVSTTKRENDRLSAYWIYTLLVDKKQEFMQFMQGQGVQVSSVHARNDKHTMFKDFQADLPKVTEFTDRMVCIPVGWWVTEPERKQILEAIKKFALQNRPVKAL